MKNSHIHAVGMGEETTDFSPWSIIKNHLSVNSIRYLFFNLSLLFAGLSVLFKLSGLSIVIFLAIIVLIYTKDSKQRKSLLIKCFFAAVIPLVLFIIYGAFYDLEVFLNILRTNSNRFFGVGPEIIFTLINKSVVTKSFNDGWLLLGWISLLILAFTEWKKSFGSTLILSAFFAYLFIFLLFGSEPYGWYRIPFYPFLALAISRIISRLFLLGNIYLYGFLMMLPIGTALNRLIGVTDFQVYVPYFRGIAVFVFLLFMSGLVGKYKKLEMFKKGLMLAILVFAVWLSVKLIYFYNIDNWYLAV